MKDLIYAIFGFCLGFSLVMLVGCSSTHEASYPCDIEVEWKDGRWDCHKAGSVWVLPPNRSAADKREIARRIRVQ